MRIRVHRTLSSRISDLIRTFPIRQPLMRGELIFKRIALAMLPVVALVTMLAVVIAPRSAVSQMTGELELGLSAQKVGNLREAVEIYSELLRKNPKLAEAYNWRGLAYLDLGETDKALADFNKALESAPNYADAFNNRGEIFRTQNKLREALNDYSRAVQLEPNFAEASFNIGLVSEKMNRPQPAAVAYETYLKLKPDAPEKAELQAKINTLRQAAAAQAKPGPGTAGPPPANAPAPGAAPPPAAVPPPVAQKPADQSPERPAAPRPGVPPQAQKAVPPPPAGVDLGIPGVPPIDPEALASAVAGASIVSLILNIIIYLFVAFMIYFIAKKTNTSLPWLAFIPIAQLVLLIMVARKPIWWIVLFFVPIIGAILAALLGAIDPTGGIITMVIFAVSMLIPVVAALLICLGIASARGKSVAWGILLFIPCTSPIALAYLGLSK